VETKTLEFLRRLRDQVRGRERFGEDHRNVYTGDVARELGMDRPEYERRLEELVSAGYLLPHPNILFERQGVYRITDEGIAAADQDQE
jgi:DNA-binding MarR family transcriptional regulator